MSDAGQGKATISQSETRTCKAWWSWAGASEPADQPRFLAARSDLAINRRCRTRLQNELHLFAGLPRFANTMPRKSAAFRRQPAFFMARFRAGPCGIARA